MTMLDCEKLQLLSDILCAIPRNEGQIAIWLDGVSVGFNYLTIVCFLNWKCDKRYYECRSLDEAIKKAEELYREIMGYFYAEREHTC